MQRSRDLFVPTIELFAALILLLIFSGIALRHATRITWIPVAAVWFVLGIAAAEWQPSPPYPNALMAYADNLSRAVDAHVVRVRAPAEALSHSEDADQIPSWELTEETPEQNAQSAVCRPGARRDWKT